MSDSTARRWICEMGETIADLAKVVSINNDKCDARGKGLEDLYKRVEALENDSLMQYEMDKPDPDPPEEETK